jgi:hypothetical protein
MMVSVSSRESFGRETASDMEKGLDFEIQLLLETQKKIRCIKTGNSEMQHIDSGCKQFLTKSQ